MTTRIYFATHKLGDVAFASLQEALQEFDLGILEDYKHTEKGVMGQTLLVRTSQGDYILKGNPLYAGQLEEEQFFAEQLSEHTTIPVPVPYLLQKNTDLLGWSYAIMPRLPGKHLYDPVVQSALGHDEHEEIAAMLAHSLIDLHRWKVPDAGEYDPIAERIVPFAGTYLDWLYGTIRHWLLDAQKYSVITDADIAWVDEQLKNAEAAFQAMPVPGFVMGDFKVENFVIEKAGNRASDWRISGLFDFTTSYFGDGTADLTKMTAMYIHKDQPELAKRFLLSYRDVVCAADEERCKQFAARLRIHLLYQRILLWGEAKATHQVTWEADLPFATWAQHYVDSVLELLD